MKKEIAKKWIRALRSGKYKRGEGYLKQLYSKKTVKHCCLGVLCELYNESMKKNHKKSLNTRESDGIIRFGKETQVLPVIVKKWAGMKTNIGDIFNCDNVVVDCLAGMNDSGKKFTTIAKVIEENAENI